MTSLSGGNECNLVLRSSVPKPPQLVAFCFISGSFSCLGFSSVSVILQSSRSKINTAVLAPTN